MLHMSKHGKPQSLVLIRVQTSEKNALGAFYHDRNMYEIPRSGRCKNRRKKNTPKKNNLTQDSIYMVQQFTYVQGVAGISLFSRKITECSSTVFSL